MRERCACQSPHRDDDAVGVFARTLYVEFDVFHHSFEVEGGIGGGADVKRVVRDFGDRPLEIRTGRARCLFRLRKLLLLRFWFAGLGAPAAVAGKSDMSKKSDGMIRVSSSLFRIFPCC